MQFWLAWSGAAAPETAGSPTSTGERRQRHLPEAARKSNPFQFLVPNHHQEPKPIFPCQ